MSKSKRTSLRPPTNKSKIPPPYPVVNKSKKNSIRPAVHQKLYELAFVVKVFVLVTLCFRNELIRNSRINEKCPPLVPPTSVTPPTNEPTSSAQPASPSTALLLSDSSDNAQTGNFDIGNTFIYILWAMLAVDVLILAVVLATQAFNKCRLLMTAERLAIPLTITGVLSIVEIVLFSVLGAFNLCAEPGGIVRAATVFDIVFLVVNLLIILLSFVWPKDAAIRDEEMNNQMPPMAPEKALEQGFLTNTAKSTKTPVKSDQDKVVHKSFVTETAAGNSKKAADRGSRRTQSLKVDKDGNSKKHSGEKGSGTAIKRSKSASTGHP